MRRWKDFHWDISSSSRFLRKDFSLYRISFRCVSKSTFICVETTLYWIKCKPLKSIPDCIAHTMQCTLALIQHGGGLTWNNVLVSNISGVLIQKIILLLDYLNREKLLSIEFWSARQKKSVTKGFSVLSFLNHGNDTIPETIVTVKS